MKKALLIGQPLRISIGRISAEEKAELLMKETFVPDEGVGSRSLEEINDFLDEYGLDLEGLEIEVPGGKTLSPEVLKRQTLSLELAPPPGDYLLVKRYLLLGEELAGHVLWPSPAPKYLAPLALEGEALCDDLSLVVGFFAFSKAQDQVLAWVAREIKAVPGEKQGEFLRNLEASLLQGKWPTGKELPGPVSFLEIIPENEEVEERLEVFVLEVDDLGIECHPLEIEYRPLDLEVEIS